jgi:hypothetical protein
MDDYNQNHPHGSLQNKSPINYAKHFALEGIFQSKNLEDKTNEMSKLALS